MDASTKRKMSQAQEKAVAKAFNGRTTPASGALPMFKGDVKSKSFLIECKSTDKDFYIFSLNVWLKIRKEAIREGLRTPLYCVRLKDLDLVAFDQNSELMESRVRDYKFRGFAVEEGKSFKLLRSKMPYFSNQPKSIPSVSITFMNGEEKIKLMVVRQLDFEKLFPKLFT
jgi:hypothetical protein